MPKITAEDFLKSIGFKVKDLESDDADLKALTEKFHADQRAHYFELFPNSDEYKSLIEKFEGQVYAKHQKVLNGAIKKAGLTFSDDEEIKLKPQEKVEKLVSHLRENNTAANDVKTLQEENIRLKNEVNQVKDDARKQVESALSEADKKVLTDKINFHLKNKFRDIPKERLVGNEHLDIHWIALDSKLKDKYDISLDEKGEFVFYKKGTTVKAEGKKDGRDVILTPDEVIIGQLKENKSWVESNGQGQQAQQTQRPITTENKTGKGSALLHRLEEMTVKNGQQ